MKRLFLVLFIVFYFSSCDIITNSIIENNICGQELYDGDFPELNSFVEIAEYLDSFFIYIKDDNVSGVKESIIRGYGDCDERALIFINIAYYSLGIKMEFVALNTTSRSIGIGGSANHAEVRYNGVIYKTSHGLPLYEIEASYYYSFDDIFDY